MVHCVVFLYLCGMLWITHKTQSKHTRCSFVSCTSGMCAGHHGSPGPCPFQAMYCLMSSGPLLSGPWWWPACTNRYHKMSICVLISCILCVCWPPLLLTWYPFQPLRQCIIQWQPGHPDTMKQTHLFSFYTSWVCICYLIHMIMDR
jgi:hypothetical protein